MAEQAGSGIEPPVEPRVRRARATGPNLISARGAARGEGELGAGRVLLIEQAGVAAQLPPFRGCRRFDGAYAGGADSNDAAGVANALGLGRIHGIRLGVQFDLQAVLLRGGEDVVHLLRGEADVFAECVYGIGGAGGRNGGDHDVGDELHSDVMRTFQADGATFGRPKWEPLKPATTATTYTGRIVLTGAAA